MTPDDHAAAAAHARRHEAAQHGRGHAPHLRALGRRLQRLPRPLAGPAHARGRARLPAAPGRPRAQGQQHLPDHERLALPLRRHARPAARQAARIPLPRKADPLPAILSPDEVARLLAAVARPVDARAADHGLRRRPARLRGRRAPGHRHRQRPDDHPRPRGQGRARPLRHALAAAARDPARPLAPHPLAPPGCSRGRTRPGRSRSARCSAPAARRSRPPGSTSR